jgi:hypothetical protein
MTTDERRAKVEFKPVFSWDMSIEQELLRWARYMRQCNLEYIDTTIWGRKQKREAAIYAHVFEMVEKKVRKEIGIRQQLTSALVNSEREVK